MGSMAKAAEKQRDHVDRFLDSIKAELAPGVDLAVEGIVDRITGLSRRLRRLMEETLAEHELSWGEWKVLGLLRHHGPPYRSSPGHLAENTDLSSGAMTNRLDRLEEAGLVRRLPDPSDRRGVQVELTEAGHAAYEQSTSTQAAKETLIASALNEREKEQLNALLRRLMIAFEELESRH
jgi:DNA-binding MarR family transcriptional regulator